jgi:hypothetical protein
MLVLPVLVLLPAGSGIIAYVAIYTVGEKKEGKLPKCRFKTGKVSQSFSENVIMSGPD